jgi:hypothetical protein
MTFTPVFGGGPIAPSNNSYAAVALTADMTLVWDLEQQDGVSQPVANIMDVTPAGAGLSILMPAANQGSLGTNILFTNLGANTFTVKDAGGNTLFTVASGEAWSVYLANNSTVNGIWRVFEQGAGTSTTNAGTLAGAGIKAISTSLNQSIPYSNKNTDYTAVDADRATMLKWTGGVGTFTMPQASVVGSDWFTIVKNVGSGTLTVDTAFGETIDSSVNVSVDVGESFFVMTDGTNFFTIGFGRSTVSSFDFINIDVAGTGDYTLAGVELNRVAYDLTGILTGNRNIIVPSSVQQYWVQNNTTGAFTLTVKTAAGTGVTVPQGTAVIVFCDGTDVINAADSTGVTFPISIGQGGTGQITAAAALAALLGVPQARVLTAGLGLDGGGDLSADRTFDVNLLGLETLADPGADRVLFWDDSAGFLTWLTMGTNLSITGTTLNAASSGPSVAKKTSPTTRASTITVTDDPSLVTSVSVGPGTYRIQVQIPSSSFGAGGFRWKIQHNGNNGSSVSSSTKLVRFDGANYTVVGEESTASGDHLFSHATYFSGMSSVMIDIDVTFTSAQTGTFAFMWAQENSNASGFSIGTPGSMVVTALQ